MKRLLILCIAGSVAFLPLTTPAEETAPPPSALGGKISLELKNVDVIEVLKLLSRKGNINMITGPNVRGRVTLFLDNVEVWDALRMIFETNDLAYVEEAGIMKVITGKEYEALYGRKFDDKRELRVIPILHADANDIASTIKQTRNVPGTITVDDRTNALVVLEMPEFLETIERTVKQLDVPVTTRAFSLKFTSPGKVEEAAKNYLSKKGHVATDALTNKVIVTDFAENVEKIAELVRQLDSKPYLETRVFPLSYAKHDEIEAKLKELVTKEIGMIRADQRTNKIVVTDFPEKLAKMEQMVIAYDEKSREVLIEAKIVEVKLTDDYKFGINWESIFNDLFFQDKAFSLNAGAAFEQITQAASTSTVFFQRATSTPGMRLVGTGPLGGSVGTFNAVLDALKTVGDTQVLSNPRVTAISGQEAVFKVVTREAFVTDTVVQNPAAATTAENVTFVDVGVNLKITPTINSEGYVTLKIKPEISSVASTLTTASNNTIPIVSSQELETVVMVKDGATIILGGLIEDKAIITSSRVPVLGSLPLIGMAFRKDTHDIDKRELVFFLTPTVVTGESDFLASSRRALKAKERMDKLLWKDRFSQDFPDRMDEIAAGVYPSDGPRYIHDPSAMVSPLYPKEPPPSGQLRKAPPVEEAPKQTIPAKRGPLQNWVRDVLDVQD